MGDEIRSYEDLTAWRLAVELSIEVYSATQSFPQDERFGLIQQLRRAAVSIPSNIAEGAGGGRGSDFGRVLGMARGALYEVETQLLIASRLGYLDDHTHAGIRSRLEDAGRVLAGLIRSTDR